MESMQLCPTATLPPLSDTIRSPASALSVPPQVVCALAGSATTRLTGKGLSGVLLKLRLLRAPDLLLIMKVSLEIPPRSIVAGSNVTATTGPAAVRTSSVATAGSLTPRDEVTLSVEFLYRPLAVETTSRENVQSTPAASVPPV